MGQSVEDSSAVDSLREPLLVNKTIEKDIDNNSPIDEPTPANNGNEASGRATTQSSDDHIDGVDTRILEHIGSPLTYYVIGQWIWLFLVWTNMRDVVDEFHVTIMAWSFVMGGHYFFLTKLSLLVPAGGRKESRARTAKVNQETLPAILSGLRVFCLDSEDIQPYTADQFLVVIALSFLLFELCRGSSGCGALSAMLVRKKHCFDEVVVDCYEHPRQSDDMDAMDRLEAPKVGIQADGFDNEKKDELDWGVIGQWIWLLVVWFTIRIEFGPIFLCEIDACILTWLIGMFLHGIFLAFRTSQFLQSPSRFCVNRENLPMVLSTFFLFSFFGTADQFLVVIATWFMLSQIIRGVWRFSVNMFFTNFSKMEKEYFERLKEQEPEEAAKLEAQMQRMAYLETLPRPDPAKNTRKQLLAVLGPITICFCLIALTPPEYNILE